MKFTEDLQEPAFVEPNEAVKAAQCAAGYAAGKFGTMGRDGPMVWYPPHRSARQRNDSSEGENVEVAEKSTRPIACIESAVDRVERREELTILPLHRIEDAAPFEWPHDKR